MDAKPKVVTLDPLLRDAAERAARYLAALDERSVVPGQDALDGLSELDTPLPDGPTDPAEVLAALDEIGSPATIASAGGRYFGFVTGATLPAALAAHWLATAWDQNVAMAVMSPAASRIEAIALRWLLDVLHLPPESGGGFVTSATMGNFSGLLAARHALLARKGWDVEARGLFGAPEIKVVVGDEVHSSLLKALTMAGFGRERLTRVPADDQGRIRADALPEMDDLTLLCIQAGNVNSGAFDPAGPLVEAAHQAGAWVHVDGAFGLWAAAAPGRAQLMAGYEGADSWATDAHKWLNVPYDSGLVFCRDRVNLRAAMVQVPSAYLHETAEREPMHYTPEMSRRARAVDIWAALHSLGRGGLADLIERTCRLAGRFAEKLGGAGFDILNEVVINQVMVSFGDDAETRRVIAAAQAEGTMWAGSTQWHGREAMRISVSSWATTEEDVDRSVEALIRIAKG